MPDPVTEHKLSRRHLPHWFREGATYFVTFRLGDSVPAEVLKHWRAEQEAWLSLNPAPHSPEQLDERDRLFSESRESFLNAGYGSCVLRRDDVADIVEEALNHFDNQRYDLGDWVIMANHVHLLVTPREGYKLSDILHSWKSFTANKINKLLGRAGMLWQHESYDHIVRSDAQLEHYRRYIADNPRNGQGRIGFQPVVVSPKPLETGKMPILPSSEE